MRYAAIGDSFTEGVGDPLDDGSVRGWADMVAAGLAAGLDEPVEYVNVAIRGRLIEPIVLDQLETVLALRPRPDLVTFNGGGNDMMRPGFGVERVMALTERVAARCAEEGVRVVMLTGGDPTDRLPRGSIMRERGAQWMIEVHAFLERHPEITFVDNWADEELRRAPYWSADRLHLGPLGHARVAARVLTALGIETALPEAGTIDAGRVGALAQARYFARYVLPWIARRITRRSSGDGRSPKHPQWTAVDGMRRREG